MVGVRVPAVSGQLGVDARATRDRVVPALEDQESRPFADDEPVAVDVEWPGRMLWIVSASGQRTHVGEGRYGQGRQRRFRSACHGDVRRPLADEPGALTDGVRARGARRGDGEVRSQIVVPDADQRRGGIHHGHRHPVRVHPAIPGLGHSVELAFHAPGAALARTGHDRAASRVDVGQPGVCDRVRRRGEPQVSGPVGPPNGFRVQVLRRIESCYLAAEINASIHPVQHRQAPSRRSASAQA